MRRAARVDNNHGEIVKALRGVGATVTSLAAVGQGVGDLLVSYRARWFVLEVKSPGGKLTEDEWVWIGQQRAEVKVVYSVEDALAAIGAVQLVGIDSTHNADITEQGSRR
jgi:hypothetical protein